MLLKCHQQLAVGQRNCAVGVSQHRDKSLYQRKKQVIQNDQLQLVHYKVNTASPLSPHLPHKGQGVFFPRILNPGQQLKGSLYN